MFSSFSNFLSSNHHIATVSLQAATVLIWLFYAQLFYRQYRRAHKTRLLIAYDRLESEPPQFLVTNLCQHLVYLAHVKLIFSYNGTTEHLPITELKVGDFNRSAIRGGLGSLTLQGPLRPGEILRFGDLRQLSQFTRTDFPSESYLTLEITALRSVENTPIVFSREFRIYQKENRTLAEPLSWNTKQKTSWWHRYRLIRQQETPIY